MFEYISPAEATKVRVFYEQNQWFIDAIDDTKNFTAVCWDWDIVHGEYISSLENALALVPLFIEDNVSHLAGTRPFVPLRCLQEA